MELETKEVADLKHQLKIKKHQLASLLSKPLFPKGFSGKYLDTNIELKLAKDNKKAVDIMKKVIEDIPMKKKERNRKSRTKRDFLKNRISKKSKTKKV